MPKAKFTKDGRNGGLLVGLTDKGDGKGIVAAVKNSGSPVINARGELIGIAFDGNWEAMSGDLAFEPDLQRCINVDIRFVLWVIDVYAGATHLIDEMQIIK